MFGYHRRAFLVVVAACYAVTFAESENEGKDGAKEVVKLSAEECFEYGFIRDALDCASCLSLEKYVDNPALVEECHLCCSTKNSKEASSGSITSAVLEVCR